MKKAKNLNVIAKVRALKRVVGPLVRRTRKADIS